MALLATALLFIAQIALAQTKHSFMPPNPQGYSLEEMRTLSHLRTQWVTKDAFFNRLAFVLNENTRLFSDVRETRDSFTFLLCGVHYTMAKWTASTARYVWENKTKLSAPASGGKMRTMDYVYETSVMGTVDRAEHPGEKSITFMVEDLDDFPEEVATASQHLYRLASTWCGQFAHNEIEYFPCKVSSQKPTGKFNFNEPIVNNNYYNTTNNHYDSKVASDRPERKYLGFKIGFVTVGLAGVGYLLYTSLHKDSPAPPQVTQRPPTPPVTPPATTPSGSPAGATTTSAGYSGSPSGSTTWP